MDKKLFGELKESLKQMADHSAGKKMDVRMATLPKPLDPISKDEVVAIRHKLNVSQAVFARYLNISHKTVQAWEQGTGRPSGAGLKLLTIAKKDPAVLSTVGGTNYVYRSAVKAPLPKPKRKR